MFYDLSNNAPVWLDWCVLFCLTSTLVVSAATDLRWRKIYNRYTYGTVLFCFAVGILNWVLFAMDSPNYSQSISIANFSGGFLGCFGVMLVIHVLGGGGAGDVKLATAIGTALGFHAGIQAIGYTYMITAVVMISLCIFQKGVRQFVGALFRSIGSRLLPLLISEPSKEDEELLKQPVPLGPGFLGAVLIVYWDYGLFESMMEAVAKVV